MQFEANKDIHHIIDDICVDTSNNFSNEGKVNVEDGDSESNALKKSVQPAADWDIISLASNTSDILSLCHSFSDVGKRVYSNVGGQRIPICEKLFFASLLTMCHFSLFSH